VVKQRQMMTDLGYSIEIGPINMYFLTKKISDKDISDIQRMIPRRDFVDKWKHLESRAHDLARKLTGKEANMPSGAWKILANAAPEDVLFLSVTTRQQSVDSKLKNFFGKWRQVREKLPFPEMAEMRITAQLPEYPKILDEAFLLLLDSKLRSHNEIVNFLKPYEPPPPPPPPTAKRGRGKASADAEAGAQGRSAPPAPAKRGRKPKGLPAAVPAPAVVSAPVAVPQGAGQTVSAPVKAAAHPEKKPPTSTKQAPAVAVKPAPVKAPGTKGTTKASHRKATPVKAVKGPAKAPANLRREVSRASSSKKAVKKTVLKSAPKKASRKR